MEKVDPSLVAALEAIIRNEDSSSDPAILWTCKSTRALALELKEANHPISHEKVAQILRHQGFNLQGTRSACETNGQGDRPAQFKLISASVSERLETNQPILIIDTRRSEPSFVAGEAPQFLTEDLTLDADYSKGIYDSLFSNTSVNVETSLESHAFALNSINGWWNLQGRHLYSKADSLFITADGAGGSPKAGWKEEIQKLAEAIKLPIIFCRFPSGTSKWNRANVRLFSFLTSNWLSEPERDSIVTCRLINPPNGVKSVALGLRLDHSLFQPRASQGEEDRNLFLFPSGFPGERNFTLNPESFGSFRPALANYLKEQTAVSN
jgi:hypothetical protein